MSLPAWFPTHRVQHEAWTMRWVSTCEFLRPPPPEVTQGESPALGTALGGPCSRTGAQDPPRRPGLRSRGGIDVAAQHVPILAECTVAEGQGQHLAKPI